MCVRMKGRLEMDLILSLEDMLPNPSVWIQFKEI